MPENKDVKYLVYKSAFTDFLLSVQSAVNGLLNFFSLRRSKRFWGVVYDSVTKQPLDPVIVKLLYSDGREVETCVTDLSGRYGFLARPGKFKIFVRKSNYQFPSRFAEGGRDGIYENIYHGEFFSLKDDSEVLAPNIPMDPLKFDWNQQAKKDLVKASPFSRLLLKSLVAVVFWSGLIFLLLAAWQYYPNLPVYLYYIFGLYLLLIILPSIIPEGRLWGSVVLNANIPDLKEILLELKSAQFTQMSFGKAFVHEGGRFLLRANKGKYLLNVSYLNSRKEKQLLGQLPVRVGREGVINSTIVIKNR